MSSFSITEADIERAKFFRQLQFSLKEEARRKQKEIERLKSENAFAHYVLEVFEQESKNSIPTPPPILPS